MSNITCKAAVVFKSGELPKMVEIQVEPPKSSEIRIKMLYASLCHTDILCCSGLPMPAFPRVPGHEGVGVIESVGKSVRNLKEGDVVMVLYIGECEDECANCKSGRSNLCQKYPLTMDGVMPDGTTRMSFEGQRVYQLFSCSTWSEYVVIDSHFALKIDPQLPVTHASFLSCGFTTGFGATWRSVFVEKGSTVAVLGLGAVGLGAIAGARMQGASKIIGIDINELKREKGEAFGMTDFFNPKNSDKSVPELIKDATGGLGVDYCFECTGVPTLLKEAIEATKLGLGAVVLMGTAKSAEIDYVPLLCGRTLKGSIFGNIKPQTDLPSIIEKCINKEIQLGELLTHEVSFNELDKAFEYVEQPDCVKCHLIIGEIIWPFLIGLTNPLLLLAGNLIY